MKKKHIAIGLMLCMTIWGLAMSVSAHDKKTETDIEFAYPEEKLIRNEDGKVVGVDVTEEEAGIEYTSLDLQQLMESDQFNEYEKLGLTYDVEHQELLFAEMKVVELEDEYSPHAALQYLSEYGWTVDDDRQKIAIVAVRDEEYHLQYFEFTKLPNDIFTGEDAVEYNTETGEWIFDGNEDIEE